MIAPPELRAEAVRAIVFDLDGTLIDSYAAIARSLNHARERFGLAPLAEGVVRAGVGRGLEQLIAELVGAERVAEGVRLFRERYAREYSRATRVLPGVPETLERLAAAGHRMAVASNKPARFSSAILAALGLDTYLPCVLGPDVVDSHKPDPLMLRTCMERIHARADETVYVGDMVLDVETAARAGVPVLLVPGGSSEVEQLRATGQRVLTGFPELADLLAAVPG